MLIAAIFEFAGAVLVGNNVAESIRGRIINVSLFGKITGGATALQLGMVCALMGSSTWLMFATKMGWPVSTTHSIIGGEEKKRVSRVEDRVLPPAHSLSHCH